MGRKPKQTDVALRFLSDGQPHSHREVYSQLYMNPNVMSRLRQEGHNVRCWRDGDTYWYQLVPDWRAELPDPAPLNDGTTPQVLEGQLTLEGADDE